MGAGEQGRPAEVQGDPAHDDAHPIEEVGERLRAMMPWIGDNKLVDKEKN